MKEVREFCYAGLFQQIPFKDRFIQSPIGLVPKDNGTKTRLIFHLSYPCNTVDKVSVNANTPKQLCKVVYPDFSKAIKLCLEQGKNGKCYCSKSDWTSAFRHFPIKREYWNYLVMKARNPKDRLWYYFIDKCMPFRSSISCAHFQNFSDAITHIMRCKTGYDNVNYLDNFLFITFLKWLCNSQIQTFLEVYEKIRFPVALKKTLWATMVIVFLGMLINTERQLVFILQEKVDKALLQIEAILGSKKRKTTVEKIQKLCGLLNFLCRAIVPGRPFLMRLYNSLAGLKAKTLKSYHHVKIANDTKLDLEMWKVFHSSQLAYCHPFIDFNKCIDAGAEEIGWFTEAAKAMRKGFGGHYGSHWFTGLWMHDVMNKEPSIEYLELYAVAVSMLLWIKHFHNQRICIRCDSKSVVHMINNQSSKCRNCMVLLRVITLECLVYIVRLYVKHIRTHLNGRADALSRNRIDEFRKISEQFRVAIDPLPEKIPSILEDIIKIWLD